VGRKQDWLADRVLRHLLIPSTNAAHQALPVFTDHEIGLSTSTYQPSEGTGGPTDSFTWEVTGGGYARVLLAAALPAVDPWPLTTNPGERANGGPITFPAATTDWGIVRSFYLLGVTAGGNRLLLYGADVRLPLNVTSGMTPSWGVGALVFSEAAQGL